MIKNDCEELNAIRLQAWREHLSRNSPTTDNNETAPEIPGFQLIELIGHGGMGSVWLAEQTSPVVRKVAIKVVRAGYDHLFPRLETERQALAMLSHPNIANIFDAGSTKDGRPYFVMEFIPGINIIEYCSLNNLNLDERLELFNYVCEAIDYSHSKGIIHRDIKPSNILVTVSDKDKKVDWYRPCVKVIDFGLAKNQFASNHDRTTERTVLGSTYWMSPEQAAGVNSSIPIDRRTDIYSLGALLYHMVTGTPPLDPKSYDSSTDEEIYSAIRQENVEAPSRRARRIIEQWKKVSPQENLLKPLRPRRELDWIILKALEKNPTNRYETAVQLATDVRCYIECRPVAASHFFYFYYARLFWRKSIKPLALIAVVGLVLGIIRFRSGNSSTQTSEKNDAHQQLEFNQLKQDKSKIEQLYLQSLDKFSPFGFGYVLSQKDDEFLRSQLERLDEQDIQGDTRLKTANKIASIWYAHCNFKEALNVLDHYQTEVNAAANRLCFMESDCIRGHCEIRLGDPLRGLARIENAIESYEAAEDHDAAAIRKQKSHLASSYIQLGKFSESSKLVDMLFTETFSKEDQVDMAHLNCLLAQADIFSSENETEDAIDVCQRGMLLDCTEKPKDVVQFVFEKKLLDIYMANMRYAEASRLVGQVLEESLKRFGQQHPVSLDLMKTRAVCRFKTTNEKTESIESLNHVLELAQDQHPEVRLKIELDLANLYLLDNRYFKAAKVLENSDFVTGKTKPYYSPDAIKAMNTVGKALSLSGEQKRAHEILINAFHSRGMLGKPNSITLNTLVSLVPILCFTQEKPAIAVEYLNQFIFDCESELGKSDQTTLAAKLQLGQLLLFCGRYHQCAGLADNILKCQELPTNLKERALLLATRSQIADDQFEMAQESLNKLVRPEPTDVNKQKHNVEFFKILQAHVCLKTKDAATAQKILNEKDVAASTDPMFITYRKGLLGQCKLELQDLDAAELFLAESFSLWQKAPIISPEYRTSIVEVTNSLCRLYELRMDSEQAKLWQDQSEKLESQLLAYENTFGQSRNK